MLPVDSCPWSVFSWRRGPALRIGRDKPGALAMRDLLHAVLFERRSRGHFIFANPMNAHASARLSGWLEQLHFTLGCQPPYSRADNRATIDVATHGDAEEQVVESVPAPVTTHS